MIDFEKYTERFEIAQEQKESSTFRDKILEELKKAEWSERKADLEKSLSNIKDERGFDKYQKELAKLFNDIFEVITAPGVDAFVNWLNDLTDNKSDANTKKLRKYLVDNYSAYSEQLDSVISNKEALNVTDNSIFAPLLSEANKAIKKDCNAFLSKPAEFENTIDSFIEELGDNLSGLNDIEELAYTTIDELYTEEQKNNGIDFYADIIEKFLKANQKLDTINDADKDKGIITKAKDRISDIKKCIEKLDRTNIVHSADETVKEMFLSFKDDMIKFEKGISQNLEEFLEQKWEDIISHYDTIKLFFTDIKEIIEEDSWKNFKAKDEIAIVVLKYNALKKENPLTSLKSKSILSVQQTLTKKFNEILDYDKEANNSKQAILDAFNNTIKEYSEKLELIEKLDTGKTLYNKINDDGIAALKNGCEAFKNQNIIEYLTQDFNSDLNTYNNIKNWFNEVLQKSGLSPQIDWLENLLNAEDAGEIAENEFNPDILKELLSNKLITLTITKTY